MSPAKVVTLLLIGVIGGILIAPAKGTKTRRNLAKFVDDISDSMQDIIDIVRGEGDEYLDTGVKTF